MIEKKHASPTLWHDWRIYATEKAYPPQNRHVLLVLSPCQIISASAAAAATTQKPIRENCEKRFSQLQNLQHIAHKGY
jgi:hypothetical protein